MRYFKAVVLPLLGALFLTGCLETVQTKATALKNKAGDVVDQLNPASRNEVKTVKNDFDGSEHKFVKPGHVYRAQSQELENFGQNANFALGASWSSADPNNVLLVALQLKLTRPFTRLEFNVGGNIIKINNIRIGRSKIDEAQLRYYNQRYNQRSLRFYQVTRAQFNQIVNDGKAKARIFYGDGYYDGDIGIEKSNAAIIGFRNLKKSIDTKS